MARRWDLSALLSTLRLPTPAYYAGGLAIGFFLHLLLPIPLLSAVKPLVLGMILLAGGAAVGGLALQAFRKAGTGVSSAIPSSALVVDGPYRWSRNPMNLAMAVLYAGFAFLLNGLGALLLLPLVIYVVQRRVLEPEERYLEQRFGDAYVQYKARVRRWV